MFSQTNLKKNSKSKLPAVSQRDKAMVIPSTTTWVVKLSKTVWTYPPGNC